MKKIIFLILTVLNLYANQFEPIVEETNYDKRVVSLGRELFADPILSKDNSISCLSCHFEYGADPRPQSFGINGAKGEFNAPSVFNATFNFFNHWSGEIPDLKEQFDNPVKAEIEMSSTPELINQKLNNSPKYIELFQQAYGEKPSYELAKDAVVAFEQTLVTPAKFDFYLLGKEELNQKELRGFEIFKNYGCASCHNGKNIGGNSIQKFGTIIPMVKGGVEQGYFKVPSLRNVEKTAPYFHDGSEKSLQEAIELMGYHNLGAQLTKDEIQEIEAFLKTLTGPEPKTWGFK